MDAALPHIPDHSLVPQLRTTHHFEDKQSEKAHNLQGFGRGGGDRTDDLFHAMEARSQLRHRPTIEDKKPTLAKSGSRQVRIHFRRWHSTPTRHFTSQVPRL